MSRALSAGRTLRDQLQVTHPIDMEVVAEKCGLKLLYLDLPDQIHEIQYRSGIGVNRNMDDLWIRWGIAHGVGHKVLHPALRIQFRATHDQLCKSYEYEAEDFAYGLLVPSTDDCRELGLLTRAAIAKYAGVPEHIARLGYPEETGPSRPEESDGYWMYEVGWGTKE